VVTPWWCHEQGERTDGGQILTSGKKGISWEAMGEGPERGNDGIEGHHCRTHKTWCAAFVFLGFCIIKIRYIRMDKGGSIGGLCDCTSKREEQGCSPLPSLESPLRERLSFVLFCSL